MCAEIGNNDDDKCLKKIWTVHSFFSFFFIIARTLVPHLICDTYNPQNTENDFDPHQRSPTMLPDPDNLSDVYMPSRHYSQNVRFCEGTAMWKWNKCPKIWNNG